MDIDQIERIMKLFSESEIGEFFLKEGSLEIELRKKPSCPPPLPGAPRPPFPMVSEEAVKPPFSSGQERLGEPSFGVPAEQPPKQVPAGNKVESPLVGTFYAAPSPDAEPFVKKGDTKRLGRLSALWKP